MTQVNVAIGVIRDKFNRLLITQRKLGTHLAGLWEFPGGKFAVNEEARSALERELDEELNIQIGQVSPLINIKFDYPDVSVSLFVYEVHDFIGLPIGREGQKLKWVAVSELDFYPFPEANRTILSAIKLGRQYAIIGDLELSELLSQIDYLAKQGVNLVQIRIKNKKIKNIEDMFTIIRERCRLLKIRYLINSDVRVVKQPSDGLHLTSAALMTMTERPKLSGYLAASCHSLQELKKAEQLKLDFAVLSPVKKTTSHLEASPLGWTQWQDWVAQVNIPVFALGGMLKEDYEIAIHRGAQGLAGMGLYKYS